MLRRLIPHWLRDYRRDDLSGDIVGGLTTAVMLVPQAMAYAMLAGLPPIVGLYASTIPLALYALLGSSRHLAVGPVAMVSLLVASGVGALAAGGTADYITYALMLAIAVGAIQLAMGVFRLGFLVTLLSHPVISGFTSAAALIIGFSQIKHLVGLDIARTHYIHETALAVLGQIADINPITLIIGLASIALLVGLKRWWPSFPRALAAVVIGSLAVWLFGLHDRGVAIVGNVPGGLPGLSWPSPSMDAMKDLLPIALVIALVGFMESISVAKSFARQSGYTIDANRELIALGTANLGAGLFSGYPVTGGFSRTAVNAQAGARTPLASLITATVVALVLSFFTPWFYYLPRAVLAAIIIAAVFGLIDVREARRLYHVNRADLALLAATFATTLSFGIEAGIATGVIASLAWLVLQTNRPHLAVLGRLPGTHVFRNVERFADAERFPGILIVRIDGPIYFGNTQYLQRAMARLEAEHCDLRAVIIDAGAISQIDSSADSVLHHIAAGYRQRGVALYLAGPNGPVRDAMARSGLREQIGPGQITRSVQDALDDFCAREPSRRSALKGHFSKAARALGKAKPAIEWLSVPGAQTHDLTAAQARMVEKQAHERPAYPPALPGLYHRNVEHESVASAIGVGPGGGDELAAFAIARHYPGRGAKLSSRDGRSIDPPIPVVRSQELGRPRGIALVRAAAQAHPLGGAEKFRLQRRRMGLANDPDRANVARIAAAP